ncbi:MAG: right-handed parallel beta-helix repeat-containing protein [Kiritimatiellales bacterium]|nr:right-handed parallel beta-helix repeat-containing protein [Kiritimatiellales bacterium]
MLFSLTAKAVASVILLSPADNGSTYMIHPHFRWVEDPGADRYEIQIATNSSFATLQQSDSIPVPRYIPKDWLTMGSDYWWRVRAQYAGGGTSVWSESRRLTVDAIYNVYRVAPSNSLESITNTIAAAQADTPSRLIFDAGSYNLDLPDGSYLFKLSNVSNMYIEGNHCEITMNNPNSGFSFFTSCEDILLRRFKVDYATTNGIPVTHTAGTVVSVDASTASFVFQPLENYLPPDDPRIRDATSRRWGCLMDPTVPGRLKTGVNNWFDITTNVVALGGNQYRLELSAAQAGRISDFEVGDTFVKSAIYGRYVMYSQFCTDITYEMVTSYAGAANHFIGHWNNGIHFLGCASRIKPGRLVSNGNGGYVGSGYRTGLWIEGCLTEGMFDDAVNCANKPLNIYEKTATNAFVAYQVYPAPLLAVGEHLTLYNPQSGQVNGTFGITNLEWLATAKKWKVTVDGDLGEVFPGSENWNTQLFIDERAHPYAYIRNNTFRNSRRYGCLFRSHGGVIEGNTFSGLSEAAIHGENECSSFAEGFEDRDVRILGNTIEDCGYSSPFFSQDHGAIELGISAYGTTCTQTVHQNIEIAGNDIYDWDGKGIAVENAGDILIHDNVIDNLNATTFYPGGKNYGVYLNHTANAVVTGNSLLDTRPMDAAVQVENSTNCIVLDNQTL